MTTEILKCALCQKEQKPLGPPPAADALYKPTPWMVPACECWHRFGCDAGCMDSMAISTWNENQTAIMNLRRKDFDAGAKKCADSNCISGWYGPDDFDDYIKGG